MLRRVELEFEFCASRGSETDSGKVEWQQNPSVKVMIAIKAF